MTKKLKVSSRTIKYLISLTTSYQYIKKTYIPLRIKAIKVGTFAVLAHIISKMYKLAISRSLVVSWNTPSNGKINLANLCRRLITDD